MLQRLALRLTTRLGSLDFAPEFGSRLHLLAREKPSARAALAQAYVSEAVAQEADVTLERVEWQEGDGIGRLEVYFLWQGQAQQLALEGVIA